MAFFESRLSTEEAAGVEEHLAACDACRRVLREYAAMAGPPTSVTEPVASDGAPDAQEVADLARRVALAQAQKRVGTTLAGRWTIDRLIGIGGMAQVFAATHRNGRAVAIKVMRPELAVESALVERFLREGYVANRIEHPGAVAILDDDVTPDGVPFLVMELLSGCTLQQRLREGPLPVGEALRVADDVLDVLAFAHDRGIVHRDIKPDNLFVTTEGRIKVLDFGIARLREQTAQKGHTQSGITMGTLGFMPPEQARATPDAIDGRSDVWALGATLYTILTGKLVHEADVPNEALLLAMTTPVAPTKTLAPTLPESVCAILDRALAFDKASRFADCRAMQVAIRATGLADPAITAPVSLNVRAAAPAAEITRAATPVVVAQPVSPRRSWRVPAAVGAAAIAAVATAVLVTRPAPPPPSVDRAPPPPPALEAVEPPPVDVPRPIAAQSDPPPAPEPPRVQARKPAPPHAPPPPPPPKPAPSAPLDPLGSRR